MVILLKLMFFSSFFIQITKQFNGISTQIAEFEILTEEITDTVVIDLVSEPGMAGNLSGVAIRPCEESKLFHAYMIKFISRALELDMFI